ncbi:MAG: transglutaminase family protein [Bacteroidetes bacterium]|nr:transglutaminase family protein [Bacteroidota bacterium]MBU1485228.1 transglutaminase family protein [Bacteroidota bacterium]MBU2046660.1 transglutaminase family protein [Bacteroidota bacterium]MBU2375468.1 transglutaminase family protein [Bacteroidota bacterium]
MPKFTVHHTTTYTYESTVYDSANQIMLFPIKDKFQEVVEHQLKITGDPLIDVFTDYYGNEVGTFTHPESHNLLKIESIIIVNVKKRSMPDTSMFLQDQWNSLKYLATQVPYINFLKQENFKTQEEILTVINPSQREKNTPFEVAKYLCDYVYKNFKYIKGITTVETTVDEIWKLKSGVCQDFAHILLVMLRYMDIPARYVSGYICPNKNGMRGEGATHAWVEAYLPDYGWLGLDPTNNCLVDDTHVRLAVGRNFVDCSPVKGTYKGTSKHKLEVKVSVSYENDPIPLLSDDADISEHDAPVNSYRKFMEFQQQQ